MFAGYCMCAIITSGGCNYSSTKLTGEMRLTRTSVLHISFVSKCVIIHSSPRKEVITVPIDANILFVALG